MRKLTLQLDELEVESFDTESAAASRRGTVRGHDTIENQDDGSYEYCAGGGGSGWIGCISNTQCVGTACNPWVTCGGNTCGTTCGSSCGGTCAFTCGNPTCAPPGEMCV